MDFNTKVFTAPPRFSKDCKKSHVSYICIALLQQHVEEEGDSEDNLSQSFNDIDNDIDNDNDHQCGG